MRIFKTRFSSNFLFAGLLLLSLSAFAQAAGYHNPGQYFGPPPQPYQARDWTHNPYAPAAPVIGKEGGGYYGYSGYQQPYYPSQPSYSTGGFRSTSLDSNYSTSGVYRQNY